MKEQLTAFQMQTRNDEHQTWLEHPLTQLVIQRIQSVAAPAANTVDGLDGAIAYTAQSLLSQGARRALLIIQAQPYPDSWITEGAE